MNIILVNADGRVKAPVTWVLAERLRKIATDKGERALRRELRISFPTASGRQLACLVALLTRPSIEFSDAVDAEHWGLVLEVDVNGTVVCRLDTMNGEKTNCALRHDRRAETWSIVTEVEPGVFVPVHEYSPFAALDDAAGAFYERDPAYRELARQRELRKKSRAEP